MREDVAWYRLDKHVLPATDTNATIQDIAGTMG
jgi:hypothetical protein